MMSEPDIVIREYDPAWRELFETLRKRLLDTLGGLTVTIEHVGSTAVPGLAAKPIVDIDAVVSSAEDISLAVERLERVGYQHEGDLGITGREALRSPIDIPWHHLYVLTSNSEELRRHIAFRDYLRSHPEEARIYGALKREFARRFKRDRQAYTDSKDEFVKQVLSQAIRQGNEDKT